MNYATINAIHIFVLVVMKATDICLLWPVIRSKPFAAVKNCIAAKKQKVRVFNINHKDFTVIQNVYDFCLLKVHIDMNVYKKIFL